MLAIGAPLWAVHAPGDAPLAVASEDVQRLRASREMTTLVDLRTADAFGRGHVARARSLPLTTLRRRQAEVPRAGRHGETTQETAAAYPYIRDAGYRNVMVLAGELRTLMSLGLPVEPQS